ncbi:MAG: cytidylyltransferase domain-containing protein [Gemmatimonadales bacterium]
MAREPRPYVLATVCARGGSKGVPRKNLRPIAGVPLIERTIRVARAWGGADRLVVSTDDDEIAAVAAAAGAEVPFRRPAELATDSAGKWEVLRHAVASVATSGPHVDVVVDLDPTAPLRIVEDIQGAVALFVRERPDAVITVFEAQKNPYFNMVELKDGLAVLCKRPGDSVKRRQDAPQVYSMNASIYVLDREFLFRSSGLFEGRLRAYVMPRERSVDIDSEVDYRLAELLLLERGVEARR